MSLGHEIYSAHDLEVVGLNPSRVELRVRSTCVYVVPEPKISIASASVYLRASACSPQTSYDNVAVHFFKEGL